MTLKMLLVGVIIGILAVGGFFLMKKVRIKKGLTFLGEFELAEGPIQDPGFAEFERLPFIEVVRSLAGEFAGALELQPFQKDGIGMQLLVSVYLQPKNSTDKIIAVLVRAPYPADLTELSDLVEKAATRIAWLKSISHRFEQSSILAAENSLSQISRKLKEIDRGKELTI